MSNLIPIGAGAATSSAFTNADGSVLTLYIIGTAGQASPASYVDIQYMDSNGAWNTVYRLGNGQNACVLIGAGTFQALRYADSGQCGLDSQ
jgi:hypothetical protein